MIRKGLSEEVALGQSAKGREGTRHAKVKVKRILDRENKADLSCDWNSVDKGEIIWDKEEETDKKAPSIQDLVNLSEELGIAVSIENAL